MKITGWLVGAVVGLLLLVPSVAFAQSGGGAEIRGRVLDDAGAPVEGASVRVLRGGSESGTDISGADGGYRVAVGGPGGYVVRVSALGYREFERDVTLGASEPLELDVRLKAAPIALSGVMVSATRSSTPVSAIPGAVTVIGRDRIEEEARLTPQLGAILSKTVPGLSAGNQSMSNWGQALRGRNVAVLIDGVPQSTSRNVQRDFSTIDPAAIERIEVLRGATSIYGDGATGGVINIITRAPESGRMRFGTEVGVESSMTNTEGSVGPRLTQSISGRTGDFDVVLSGTASRSGSFYDAEGDMIPVDPHGQGGVAEMETYNLLAKVGTEIGQHRLQVMANGYRAQQDTDFTTDPSVNQLPGGTQKARVQSGLRLAEPQGALNLMVSVDQRAPDVLGSAMHSQVYFRDYVTRFSPWDGRSFIGHIAQSFVDSRRFGGRLEFETELPWSAAQPLLWGVDYTDERTSQRVTTFDSETFDASGGMVFEVAGERVWVPPIDSRGVGLFVQGAVEPLPGVLLRGGLRHERVRMRVDDFTTIQDVAVDGGELSFDPLLVNVGTVIDMAGGVSAYGSFSQGFSLSDVGRVLRGVGAGFTLGEKSLEPQRVDQYEVGLRGAWSRLQSTLSVFRNESDLGTTLDAQLNVVRAPERVYGAEATLDAQVDARLDLGGTATWTEGDRFVEAADEWQPLDGFRIQPMKLTGYAQHQTLPWWSNRLQVLYSGSRDRAFEANPAGYGSRAVESYWIADWAASLDAGPGTLHVGVENIFNRQYFPTVSQLLPSGGNTSFSAARGATLSVGYSVSY